MKPRLINKQLFKKSAGKCFFCEEDDYAVLDVHRIHEGADGGRYVEHNCICTCTNCHRKIHDGQIVIDRKYSSTGGTLLHYWKNDEEHWEPV